MYMRSGHGGCNFFIYRLLTFPEMEWKRLEIEDERKGYRLNLIVSVVEIEVMVGKWGYYNMVMAVGKMLGN